MTQQGKLQPTSRTAPITIHFMAERTKDGQTIPQIQIVWNTDDKKEREALQSFTDTQISFITYCHVKDNSDSKYGQDWNLVAPIIYKFCKAFLKNYEQLERAGLSEKGK